MTSTLLRIASRRRLTPAGGLRAEMLGRVGRPAEIGGVGGMSSEPVPERINA